MDSVVAKQCCLRLNFFHPDNGSNNNNKEKNAFENNEKNQVTLFFFCIKESNYIQASRLTANAMFVLDAVLTG